MRTNNISFPHPVLRTRQGNYDNRGVYNEYMDDILPALTDDCVTLTRMETSDCKYQYEITLKQTDSLITNLIAKGRAQYACEVTCNKTFYRKSFRSSSNNMTILLDRHELADKVDFNCYISLCEPFNYNNPSANELYNKSEFKLSKGDILAIFPCVSDTFNITKESLRTGSAYMVIVEDFEGKYPSTDLSGEKIKIKLPRALYKQYGTFSKTDFNVVIHGSLVFNALMSALRHVNDDSYYSKMWSHCLRVRLQEEDLKKYDVDDYDKHYEIASIILEDPIGRIFKMIESQTQN